MTYALILFPIGVLSLWGILNLTPGQLAIAHHILDVVLGTVTLALCGACLMLGVMLMLGE